MRTGKYFLCALILLAPWTASGKNTGAAFLKIGVGARALGMGSAFTALADDVSAIHWNPGGLSMLSFREFSATHTEFIADVKFDAIGYAHPTRFGTFSIGTVYLTQGTLEGRGDNREKTASFDASDLATTLSYAKEISDGLGFGVNVKMIRQNIADESAQGIAFDLGTIIQTPIRRLTLGASALNLGPQMKFIQEPYSLPLTFSAGASYRTAGTMILAADIRHKPLDQKTSFSIGTEIAPLRVLSLRMGYLATLSKSLNKNKSLRQGDISNLGNLTGFGAGLGLKISRYQLDYAFTPTGELGNVQRLTLSGRW